MFIYVTLFMSLRRMVSSGSCAPLLKTGTSKGTVTLHTKGWSPSSHCNRRNYVFKHVLKLFKHSLESILQAMIAHKKISSGNLDEKIPQPTKNCNRNFFVPTDWVGYENFPEKGYKFFAHENTCFSLMGALFKTFCHGRFTFPPTANCRNYLIALF